MSLERCNDKDQRAINDFLDRVEYQPAKSQGPSCSSWDSPHHYHHYYHPYDPFWDYPTCCCHRSDPNTSPSSKNNNVIFAIVGLISVIFGIGYLFQSSSNFKNSQVDLSQTHKVEVINKRVKSTDLKTLVASQKCIDTSKCHKHGVYLLSTAVVLASGVSLLFGGIYSIGFFITAGTVGLISSLAISTINYLYHFNDCNSYSAEKNRNISLAKKLRGPIYCT